MFLTHVQRKQMKKEINDNPENAREIKLKYMEISERQSKEIKQMIPGTFK